MTYKRNEYALGYQDVLLEVADRKQNFTLLPCISLEGTELQAERSQAMAVRHPMSWEVWKIPLLRGRGPHRSKSDFPNLGSSRPATVYHWESGDH